MTRRPGVTSSLHLPVGVLTLQTEIVGDPPEFVTVVDIGGRVMRTLRTPCRVERADEIQRTVSRVHAELMRRFVSNARARVKPSADNDTAAQLFVLAVEAHAAGDDVGAAALMQCVADLLPDDARVRSNLAALDQSRRA